MMKEKHIILIYKYEKKQVYLDIPASTLYLKTQ